MSVVLSVIVLMTETWDSATIATLHTIIIWKVEASLANTRDADVQSKRTRSRSRSRNRNRNRNRNRSKKQKQEYNNGKN